MIVQNVYAAVSELRSLSNWKLGREIFQSVYVIRIIPILKFWTHFRFFTYAIQQSNMNDWADAFTNLWSTISLHSVHDILMRIFPRKALFTSSSCDRQKLSFGLPMKLSTINGILAIRVIHDRVIKQHSPHCLPFSPSSAGYQRSRVLHEVVDEHGPRTVLVVVGHLIVDRHREVEEQIPCVLRYWPLVVLLLVERRVQNCIRLRISKYSPSGICTNARGSETGPSGRYPSTPAPSPSRVIFDRCSWHNWRWTGKSP